MARIAIGGFQHETNTFAPLKAELADFEEPDEWPGLTRGADLFAATDGFNLPIAGFVAAARPAGHDLVPLCWCSATPSAHVTDKAFDAVAAMMTADLAAALPVDAVYLDLHGAMVTESFEDGEGELLRRVREVVGPDLPVVASLDLHANVTAAMVERATMLVAYRTYPHVDMADTGARAYRQLAALLAGNAPPAKALEKPSYLIPLNWQYTGMEPAASLYRLLEEVESDPGVVLMNFAPGFPIADIADCGPAVMAYGVDPAAAARAATRLSDAILDCEADFAGRIYSAADAVAHAMQAAAAADRPVVLADTQDNPGGGGASDGVGILTELVRQGVADAALAIMADGAAADAAHAAGIGGEISLGLGGKSGWPGEAPFEATFRVEALGDGHFTGTGPMYGGARMDLGNMALLRVGGVRIVVAHRRCQAADQAIFRHVGVEPPDCAILVLKSSVHFRADFAPIASEILVVEAPGPVTADPGKLSWRRLRPGVRVRPLGQTL